MVKLPKKSCGNVAEYRCSLSLILRGITKKCCAKCCANAPPLSHTVTVFFNTPAVPLPYKLNAHSPVEPRFWPCQAMPWLVDASTFEEKRPDAAQPRYNSVGIAGDRDNAARRRMPEFIDVDPGELYLPPSRAQEQIRESWPGKSASMGPRWMECRRWNSCVVRTGIFGSTTESRERLVLPSCDLACRSRRK
jgi:hypothetical protein